MGICRFYNSHQSFWNYKNFIFCHFVAKNRTSRTNDIVSDNNIVLVGETNASWRQRNKPVCNSVKEQIIS